MNKLLFDSKETAAVSNSLMCFNSSNFSICCSSSNARYVPDAHVCH